MVVAVIAMLVVQTTVDDVVNVIAVRYGFVTATFAVNVAVAGVNRMAAVRVGFIDAQSMLIVVAVMLMVQVAVVQIIDMAFVFDGSVAAVCAVNVVMMFCPVVEMPQELTDAGFTVTEHHLEIAGICKCRLPFS